MTKLQFTGEFYAGEEYLFTEAGEVEVRDEKAEQLLRDFPDQFAAILVKAERVEKTTESGQGTKPESKPSKK